MFYLTVNNAFNNKTITKITHEYMQSINTMLSICLSCITYVIQLFIKELLKSLKIKYINKSENIV